MLCDVSLREEVFEAAKTAIRAFGKVHIVCSNAGIGAGGKFEQTTAAVGISDVLREELAGTNISALVLCLGFVNTNIGNAQRNRPERFGGVPDLSKLTAEEKSGQEMVNNFLKGGLDPRIVGELVLEAVKGDWQYIFTDPNMRGAVEKRNADIMKGFDQAANSAALQAVKA